MEYGDTVQQRVAAFENLHGPDYAYDGSWIWYADGANRDKNPIGPLNSPPAEPRHLHSNIARFYQIKLDQAVEDFDKLKNSLTQNPGLDANNDEGIKKLRRLRHKAKQLQAKLAEHQQLLRQHSPGYLTPEEEEIQREQDAATAQAKQRYSETVSAITI